MGGLRQLDIRTAIPKTLDTEFWKRNEGFFWFTVFQVDTEDSVSDLLDNDCCALGVEIVVESDSLHVSSGKIPLKEVF